MAKQQQQLELSSVQEAEAERIEHVLREAANEDIRQLARLLASKKDQELFGQTEYQVRDIVHGLGAKALQAAANERSKKGVPR